MPLQLLIFSLFFVAQSVLAAPSFTGDPVDFSVPGTAITPPEVTEPSPPSAEPSPQFHEREPELTPADPVIPAPSPSAPPQKLSAREIHDLRIMLLEGMYLEKPTDSKRSELVTLLESAISTECMKDITRTLVYDGRIRSDECNALLEKLEELDPENPTKICASFGIDSKPCLTAYSNLVVEPYSLEQVASEENGSIEAKVRAARAAPVIEKLRRELQEVRRKRGKDEKERQNEIQQLITNMLSLACSPARSKLTPKIVPDNRPLADAALGGDDPFNKKDDGTPRQPTHFTRARQLPELCISLLNEAKDLKNFSPATCHRYGYTSPQCIGVKRRAAQLGKETAPKIDDIGRF